VHLEYSPDDMNHVSDCLRFPRKMVKPWLRVCREKRGHGSYLRGAWVRLLTKPTNSFLLCALEGIYRASIWHVAKMPVWGLQMAILGDRVNLDGGSAGGGSRPGA
jgi:hypothetical protein